VTDSPLWIAALLGLVEGLTEFLPVSSTGHLILTSHALGLSGSAVDTFQIVIQMGAILAVLFLYWRRFWGLLAPTTRDKNGFAGVRGIVLLALTTIPGAVLGLLAGEHIKTVLFSPGWVALSLAVGAVLMLLVEWKIHRIQPTQGLALDDLSARQALIIGCCQCLALWPGFSRSASTIMGGMLTGLSRETAAEYSFIAAVPILAGAAGYDLIKSLDVLDLADLPFFAVGTLVAFISALLAMKTFIRLLGRMTLRPFAIYRLLLVIPVYWFLVR